MSPGNKMDSDKHIMWHQLTIRPDVVGRRSCVFVCVDLYECRWPSFLQSFQTIICYDFDFGQLYHYNAWLAWQPIIRSGLGLPLISFVQMISMNWMKHHNTLTILLPCNHIIYLSLIISFFFLMNRTSNISGETIRRFDWSRSIAYDPMSCHLLVYNTRNQVEPNLDQCQFGWTRIWYVPFF